MIMKDDDDNDNDKKSISPDEKGGASPKVDQPDDHHFLDHQPIWGDITLTNHFEVISNHFLDQLADHQPHSEVIS